MKRTRRSHTHTRMFFGGQSVILMGHFAQLPPVKDTALYSAQPSELEYINQNHYSSFISNTAAS